MAPSEPLHGVEARLSEETRTVVNCIMARMMQLIAKLMASPDHVKQENLDELLRQETVKAISDCGLLSPPTTSEDTCIRFPLQPADHQHHHGEARC
ncbi:hypothetical protein Pmani_010188 [Petrolisthes manimaculis]|uniref:Uncharacterized protein n=1 Tax=Petrolisthes manimaculis TaxID=1843537 RepID=A0AAE1Q399_9EUCA|nr:hypothetical protein Pmani_010188 [Petrolisthes manimaculis]